MVPLFCGEVTYLRFAFPQESFNITPHNNGMMLNPMNEEEIFLMVLALHL